MAESKQSTFQQYVAPVLVGVTVAVVLGVFNWVINSDRIITELKTQYKTIDYRLMNIEKKLGP
jgi:hypothetical protein